MSSPSTGNPRSARAARVAARTNRPPAVTNASDTASCTTSSHGPVPIRRTPAAGSPFRSPASSGRDSDHAGPAAKHSVLNAAKPAPATSSRADGSTTTSMPSGRAPPSHAASARVVHHAMARPTTAPPIDSMKPSTSSCRTIARASAAKRLADRDLPAPRRAAREQQVREVEAGDQQHEHGHQHQQRRQRRRPGISFRPRADAEAGHQPDRQRLVLVGGGIVRSPACRATPLSALSAAAAESPGFSAPAMFNA